MLVGAGLPAAARTDKPIVAVFAIQDKTGQLSPTTCELLTEYLAIKLAEGGVFQVVPSRALKDRLTELKKDSYKECYDEHCQIERPREEPAAKTGPQGELALEGLLPGSRVVVDGVFRGQAPLRERLILAARDHDVRVEKPGHEAWQRLVWVHDQKVARERVALPRIVSVTRSRIVWGGRPGSGSNDPDWCTGLRYNPTTKSWRPTAVVMPDFQDNWD